MNTETPRTDAALESGSSIKDMLDSVIDLCREQERAIREFAGDIEPQRHHPPALLELIRLAGATPEIVGLESEITKIASSGGTVDDLSRAAYLHLYELNREGMPYGTMKARTGDPDEWLNEHALPDWVVNKQDPNK